MKEYVIGFVFNKNLDTVLLIHKNTPEWQRGLVNGLGGKVEAGEQTYATVQREIEEESGLKIPKDAWIKSGRIYSDTFTVDVFGTVYDGATTDATTKEDEEIEWCKIDKLPSNVIENIPWLVQITIDKIKHDSFELFEVKYKK